MIVKSAYRRAGGLHPHLLRNDTNEAVTVRLDLFRGIAGTLAEALHDMEALARLNPDIARSFIHVVLAPAHDLTPMELEQALAVVEAEHGIRVEAKRAVVQHEKGLRPRHYHCVYPIVDPVTGRALPSQGNFARDELISRILELRFGEPITPGPRMAANIGELRARNRHAEADHLAAYHPTRHADPLDRKARQQATRLGLDPAAWSRRVMHLFEEAGRNLARFEERLGHHGMRIARGDRAMLIVDDATTYETSLVRLLRREAKAAGRPLALTEADVRRAYPGAPSYAAARDEGLAAAKTTAEAARDAEWSRAAQEAGFEHDVAALRLFRARRKAERDAEATAGRQAFKATLKARRQEIVALYAGRDAVRRMRVDRAFRAARLFDSPRLRRLAFLLAASGILLSGGSLIVACIGAGALAQGLPSRARARRFQAAAQGERARDRVARSAALDRAYGDARRTSAPPAPVHASRFGFERIDKRDRILAGLVAETILLGRVAADMPVPVQRAMDALGPETVAGLTRMLERGSPLQVRRLLHWHRGVAPDRRGAAILSALERHARSDRQGGPGSSTPTKKRAAQRQAGRRRNGGRER